MTTANMRECRQVFLNQLRYMGPFVDSGIHHGKGVDLLHGVADVHRIGRRPTLLHFVAQGSQVIGGDFVEPSILEGR